MLENVLAFFKHFPEINAGLSAGLMIFARLMGFTMFAPVLHRKELPILIKVSLAFLLTIIFVGILKPGIPPSDSSLVLSLVLNIAFGALIGFIAQTIFSAFAAAGDMINMQMGLSSAVMFDPSTKSQSSIMGQFFGLFALIIFMNLGGMYWLLSAFERTFTVFPIYNTSIPLATVLNMDYLTLITSNVLTVGLQIAAPILLASLAQDIILGIISKTAPQVNVFQLSFLFKPVLGAAIMIVILPILYGVITDYFLYYSGIF